MYDDREEAIAALIPKSVGVDEAALRPPLPSDFTHLTVSRFGVVTHVQFTGRVAFADEAESHLQGDFCRLVDVLDINSKVLLDFEGVESFSRACINVLATLERKLRNRGSRIVLCSLAPDTRAGFFEAR